MKKVSKKLQLEILRKFEKKFKENYKALSEKRDLEIAEEIIHN